MSRDRSLKTTFNKTALLYDEVRPGYPDTLIKDVISLSGIPSGGSILEIGCGTGQATLPFAERGYVLICLDIGKDLAAIAAEKFHKFKNVEVVTEGFEDWNPNGQTFDLVISATAFHWISPEFGYMKAAAILKDSGSLAIFSNTHIRKKDEGFFAEAQKIYEQYAPSLCQAPCEIKKFSKRSSITSAVQVSANTLFEEPITRTYPWDAEYDAEQYIKLLSTYSDHINLPEDERISLFEGIRQLINAEYGGKIVKHYEAILNLWKKKTDRGAALDGDSAALHSGR